MAKVNSFIKIEGTLDNLTFYKGKEGYLVRTKGGVSKERIQNDPAFERTRENGSEFGQSATSGKLLRTSVRNLLLKAKDNRVTSRLTQKMAAIKNLDTTSVRGLRNVAFGLLTTEGKNLLRGFDFNIRAKLGSVVFAPFVVDTTTGEISFQNFIPTESIDYPNGATHMSLRSAVAKVDFELSGHAVEYSSVENLPIDTNASNVSLTPVSIPSDPGTQIHLLLVEFFQEINGVQYPLKNGAYNVLNIVEVV
ncbi:hypothetical protein JCM19275_198 [Nonlabens ulvanivorans]|uniref:Uncharacterized protein n=1 Tax=Nonlabens ulvanivorans TaxID=906888 RepID=A0A090WKR0_NONUL|nr:hypothetical protein [Nonlabens ulvanivorans]GAL75974.1 hypothetical protein JCM19275_198 [Nonlabens ulvanivorans]